MILPRTDLARETLGMSGAVSGVSQEDEQYGGVAISRISIETDQAAQRIEKPRGRYVTIEGDGTEDAEMAADIIHCVEKELASLLDWLEPNAHVLVVGLGNRFVTPDSLGPRTVEKLFVTRHIQRFVPEAAPKGMRLVSAMCPGVMGVTGLETVEVVRGLVGQARPDAVLCIDSLISTRSTRIASAVQINDSGVLPGAGVGNRQRGLDEDSLGVPVLAIGVPTVVSATTIAEETVRLIEKHTGVSDQDDMLLGVALESMEPEMREMVVTPKDVDRLVEDASRVLAGGINRALLGRNYEEMEQLLMH